MTINDTSVSTDQKPCQSCGKSQNKTKCFYKSNNKFDQDGRVGICKSCLKKSINYDDMQTVKDVLLQINRPFISSLWESSIDESKQYGRDVFGVYIKTIQMKDFKDLTWKEGDLLVPPSPITKNDSIITPVIKDSLDEDTPDSKNRRDVLNMIGYDPFEAEPINDKRNLYNKLVDFLDESTLEDNFKLPAVIEIVKSYSQIDKINSTISNILADVDKFASNVGGITSLVNAKEKMLKSILALAKDNGISVNHNNNKSKGSGTLSGIIKQLNEKGIDSSEINVYDIETCDGMKQVADISNRSILEQLMLNENDYTEMLKDQKELIDILRNKNNDLEEENRKIKIKLKSYEL